ncbi:unnamed protein product [Phaedon cochleariae]|uniref:Peptidase C19 ubiquitin carboxyl-terminal hydrolase domain-containing protein n=1 Tax=Phaedon cochleariae TaxID=80249 RepID=A0A9N9X194_PHACE|nr:unnamed protein product [Phaedon cochleariae]
MACSGIQPSVAGEDDEWQKLLQQDGARKENSVLIDTIPFEPIWIYKMLADFRSDLIEDRQEDAEEFLGFLLNGLNDEMFELMKQVLDLENTCSVSKSTVFEKTPIHAILAAS